MSHSLRRLSVAVMIDHLTIGGAQRLLLTQARAMRGSTQTIRVINLGQASPISAQLRALDVEVVDIGTTRLRDGDAARRVAALLRDWKPDLLHVHLIDATLLGALLARRLRIPLVVTLHNEQPDGGGLSAQVKNALERFILSHRTRHVIACGPRVASRQKSRVGRTPTTTVVNRVSRPAEVSATRRAELRVALGCGASSCLFVAIGRLAPQKGFDILLAAFAEAQRSSPDARLLIVGDGEDQKALATQLAAAGLGSSAQLLPSRPDIAEILAAADVFVLPSRWEGLPLVLLEAMAAGLPVVASAVGDVPTVVDEAGAIVVPAEDAAALANAMVQLAADPERRRRMGEASRTRSAPYVDEAAFAAELEAIYLKAASP